MNNRLFLQKYISTGLLLAGMICSAAAQLQTTYHYKKLKAAEGRLENGVKTGTWKYWNTFGLLVKEETYVNGALQGSYHEYYDDEDLMMIWMNTEEVKQKIYRKGVYKKVCLPQQKSGNTGYLKTSGWYKGGEKDSVWSFQNYQGRVYRQCTYAHNRLNGLCVEFKADGTRLTEATYRNDTLHGPSRRFLAGEIVAIGQYFGGQKRGLWTEISDNEIAEYTYRDDVLNGPCTTYTRQRRPKEICTYRDGVKQGRFMFFSLDPESQGSYCTGQYMDGVQKGIIRWYDKEGHCLDETEAQNLKRQGRYTAFHPDGSIRIRGFYANGQPDSVWTEYTPDGKLFSISNYVRNKPEGKQTQWWPDGKTIKSESNYVKGTLTQMLVYDEKGRKQQESYYEHDTIKQRITYYPSGRKKSAFSKPDATSMLEEHWFANGKRMLVRTWDREKNTRQEHWYTDSGKEVKYDAFCRLYPGMAETLLLQDEEFRAPFPVSSAPVSLITELDDDALLTIAEVMPEFPGGDGAMREFLIHNLRYPELAREMNIQGRVFLEFVVEKDGSLSGLTVIHGVHELLDQEALRVLRKMPPWTPGKMDSKPVRCKIRIPVTFKLE